MFGHLCVLALSVLALAWSSSTVTDSPASGSPVILESGAVNEARHHLDDLPGELVLKICKQSPTVMFALGKASLTSKHLRSLIRDIVIQELFESPSTCMDEFEILSFMNKCDPLGLQESVKNIPPSYILGLLHYLVITQSLDADAKLYWMKMLSEETRIPFLNDAHTFLSLQRHSNPAMKNIIHLHTNVTSCDIPSIIIDVISAFVSNLQQSSPEDQSVITSTERSTSSSVSSKDPHVKECMLELRQLYSKPFCCALTHSKQVAQEILEKFPHDNHPLTDPRVVLALRQNGIVFDLRAYSQHVGLTLDSVSEIVPLLDFNRENFATNVDFVTYRLIETSPQPETALQILKLPFIQKLIREIPEYFIFPLIALIRRSPGIQLQHCANLAELKFMPDIVNRRAVHLSNNQPCIAMKPTLISMALQARKFDIAKFLMRVPNASLYHRDCHQPEHCVLGCILNCGFVDTELLNILTEEPFNSHLLSSPQLLLDHMKHLVDLGGEMRFQFLIQHKFYWMIPNDIRQAIHQYALEKKSQAIVAMLSQAVELQFE